MIWDVAAAVEADLTTIVSCRRETDGPLGCSRDLVVGKRYFSARGTGDH